MMARRIVPLLALAAAAAGIVAAVLAQGSGRQERAGIANFTRVDAVFACAGATEVAALEGLKADGFKTVVNLRLPSERGANIEESRAKAEALGLTYVHIPVDTSNLDPAAVDRFLAVVSQPANHPVYIHCAAASRAGAMMMAKRVLLDGWDVDRAAEEARAIGMRGEALERFIRDYVAAKRKG